jgi:O-antigen/teichoic acid export membrane protein
MSLQGPERQGYGKLARLDLFWSLLREGASSLLVLPTSMILARLLSPSEFGTAAVAYFFLALGSRLGQVGLNTSIVRLKDVRPEHTSTALLVNVLIGAGVWTGLTLSAPFLGALMRNHQVADLIPVAALTFLISSVGTVPGALLSRDLHRYRARAACDWMGTLTHSIVAILLAWKGMGVWSIIFGHLASDVARVTARLWLASWRPSLRFSPSAFRELFSFGAGMYAKNLLEYIANNIDSLIVGRLLGMTSLGFYDRAFTLTSRMVVRINLAGPSASFRIFAIIHEEYDRFRRAFKRVVLAVSMVGYPLFTGLIVLAPELIQVLFGARWAPSVAPFQILCAAGMLRLLNTYASTATQAKGMIWSEVGRQMLSTIVLAVSVVFLSRWGIAGAALGVLLATALRTVLMQRLIQRLAGLQWRDLLMPQLPAAICAFGLVLVLSVTKVVLGRYLGNPASWISLPIACAIGTLYYVAFLLFSGFREVRDLVCETLDDVAPFAARPVRALTSRGVAAIVTNER